jgi:hypothetical protein
MPLFRRNDGDIVRGLPAERRVMPYLMRTRNESLVFNDSVFDIGRARAWLKAYRRTHAGHATFFHLFAYVCTQVLHARPQLNRFISGGRLYQRRGVQISFIVKKHMSDDGVGVTVKLDVPAGLSFTGFVTSIAGAIEEARSKDRAVDREVGLVMMLPGIVLRGLVRLVKLLDACNLYPEFMTGNDPMYASLFLANLGSVGVNDTYHHLYEYGTVSIFGAVSAPRRMPFVEGDAVVVKDGLTVRWTFDERVHDAFYAARALDMLQRAIEDPARHLGPPEGEPVLAVSAPDGARAAGP